MIISQQILIGSLGQVALPMIERIRIRSRGLGILAEPTEYKLAYYQRLCVCLVVTAVLVCGHFLQATEFGGMASMPGRSNESFHGLVAQWKIEGQLSWIRSSSPPLAQAGFDQVSVIQFAPPHTRNAGGRQLPDGLMALYWHCRTNLPVYPQIQQAWEVWNEPDFYFVEENPDRMASVIKAAYWGIKAGNPNAQVLMPSLAFNPDKYPRELARNNIWPYVEGYNFHFYGWAQDFPNSLAQHRQFLRDQGLNLRIWITEAGYFKMRQEKATDTLELARQQAFHERLTITAYVSGVDYYLPFILTPYSESGFDLSLSNGDFTPRPAMRSYLWLARHLPNMKPLFQIWHRPTKSDIGVVLEQSDGTWFVALWSPYRFEDTSLPPGLRNEIPNATQFELGMRFPISMTPHILKLEDLQFSHAEKNNARELFLLNSGYIQFLVSAESNLFLHTPAHKFLIRDCDWRPIALSPSKKSFGHKDLSNRLPQDFANPQLQRLLASQNDLAGRGVPTEPPENDQLNSTGSIKQVALPRPDRYRFSMHDRVAIGVTQARLPSPVILQIDMDPSSAIPHKPSQTYRYTVGQPIRTRLNLYNFSPTTQLGRLRFAGAKGWTVIVEHRDTIRSRSLPLGSREKDPGLEVSVPALSCIHLECSLIPADLASKITKGANLSRHQFVAFWAGSNGLCDVCALWLEPQQQPRRKTLVLDTRDFQPWTGQNDSWMLLKNSDGHEAIPMVVEPGTNWCERASALECGSALPLSWGSVTSQSSRALAHSKTSRTSPRFMGSASDCCQFSLIKPIPPGRMSSLFLPLPNNLRLTKDDELSIEIQVVPFRPNAAYRLNLITLAGESFRYTEDFYCSREPRVHRIRLGDLGATFWSRYGRDYTLPVHDFRFLRLSFGQLGVGDTVTIRGTTFLR